MSAAEKSNVQESGISLESDWEMIDNDDGVVAVRGEEDYEEGEITRCDVLLSYR